MEKTSVWEEIVGKDITLPTPYIKLYTTNGTYKGRKSFDDNDILPDTEFDSDRYNEPDANTNVTACEEEMDVDPTSTTEEQHTPTDALDDKETEVEEEVIAEVLKEDELESAQTDNMYHYRRSLLRRLQSL